VTDREFCYWLQGFAELSGDTMLAEPQWKMIREHLATVFRKVTPQLDQLKPSYAPAIPYDKQWPATVGTPVRPLRAECATHYATQAGKVETYCLKG